MKSRPARAVRKPLTKEMLLPLPESRVRALSLENHLALATLRTGRGGHFQMSCLLRAIYLAYFIGVEQKEVIPEVFISAERALDCGVVRRENGEGWSIAEDEWTVITPILALLDHQLSCISRHTFERAWARLLHFVSNDVDSPILHERTQ